MTTPVLPRWWAIAIVGLVAANLISLVVFWTMQMKKPHPPREPFSGGMGHLMQVMHFDSIQRQQILTLRSEHEMGMQPLLEKKRALKDSLFSLTRKTNYFARLPAILRQELCQIHKQKPDWHNPKSHMEFCVVA